MYIEQSDVRAMKMTLTPAPTLAPALPLQPTLTPTLAFLIPRPHLLILNYNGGTC